MVENSNKMKSWKMEINTICRFFFQVIYFVVKKKYLTALK